MLLDFELVKKRDIDPVTISGYDQGATTHIAVAGMCVNSAARALSPPFIPVAQKRYELTIRKEYLSDCRVSALVSSIPSAEFKETLACPGDLILQTSDRSGA